MIEAMVEMFRAVSPPSPPPLDRPVFLSPSREPQKVIDRFDAQLFGEDEVSRRSAGRYAAADPDATLRIDCSTEVYAYLSLCQTTKQDVPVFEWWKTHGRQFPLMQRLARKWLGCVATSVPSERAFSTSGNVVTVRRCSLTPELVQDLVFIAQNSK
jgi:hAT family C-terminal dimerisation region